MNPLVIREGELVNYRSQPNNQTLFLDMLLRTCVAATLYEILIGGAIGGGKSKTFSAAIIAFAQQFDGSRVYVCRRDLNDLKDTLYSDFTAMCPPGLILRPSKGIRETTRMVADVLFRNGSKIMFRELKDISGKLSLEVNAIFIEQIEEIPCDTYEVLIGRLRPWMGCPLNSPFIMALSANPHPGWVKDTFVTPKILPTNRFFLPFLPADNTDLLEKMPSYIQNMRGRLSASWLRRFVDGDWNTPVKGQVFTSFDPLVHVQDIDASHIPAHYPRVCIIDPHFAKPFAAVWVAIYPDGRRVAYDELKGDATTLPRDFILEVIRKSRTHRAINIRVLMDYNLTSVLHAKMEGKSLRMLMKEIGVNWRAVTKPPKAEQIMRMALLLTPGGGSPPRFIVGSGCPMVAAEFQSYAYLQDTFTPEVNKKNDDLLDCCFYANAEADKGIMHGWATDVPSEGADEPSRRLAPVPWVEAQLTRNTKAYERRMRRG